MMSAVIALEAIDPPVDLIDSSTGGAIALLVAALTA